MSTTPNSFGNPDKSVYFAAKEASETASTLMAKSRSFFNVLEANAYLEKLSRMWRAYHGSYDSSIGIGHQISFTGEQDELVRLHVNHFRNLGQHIYNMITSARPSMDARAINSDYKSIAQTYLANGILDYYMREKHLEDALKLAVEMAIVMGAGFIKLEWNATSGDVYDIDENGIEIKEGEIEFTNLSPFDVIFDGTKESHKQDWYMIRTFKNRFDLMAKYPELSDEIKGIPSKSDASVYRMAMLSNDETDDVPVYEFYHKKTESMPQGRYLLFVSPDAVLLDTPLPYRVLPIFRVAGGEILGTPYGYSPMFDVFPIQQAIDSLYSTIMTNNSALGVQNVFVPRGADLSIDSLHGGLNVIEGNAKPEPLNLTQTAPETFKFLEMMVQASETISGVNSVARGNPEASLKSGAALALVQSMALQFVSGLQQSYVKLIEDTGTAVIQILKDYANTPKVVALVGKNNKMLLKEFTGDDLNSINRVVVDVGNPLSKTLAGRVQMASEMMQMGIIKEPTQYFQVLNTGRIDVMYESDVSQQLLVRQENEWLSEGRAPIVSPFDIHAFHVNEHRAVLDNPDIRENADSVRIVHDHIQAHIDALSNTDPRILQLTGQQPLAPPAPPGGMPPVGPDGQPMPGPGPSGPNPGGSGMPAPQAVNKQAVQRNHIDQTVQAPPSNGPVVGPQGGKPTNQPGMPKVNAHLLPNPGAQEQAMHNVKG